MSYNVGFLNRCCSISCDVVVSIHRMVANYLMPAPGFQIKKQGLLPLLTLDQLSISYYY